MRNIIASCRSRVGSLLYFWQNYKIEGEEIEGEAKQ